MISTRQMRIQLMKQKYDVTAKSAFPTKCGDLFIHPFIQLTREILESVNETVKLHYTPFSWPYIHISSHQPKTRIVGIIEVVNDEKSILHIFVTRTLWVVCTSTCISK